MQTVVNLNRMAMRFIVLILTVNIVEVTRFVGAVSSVQLFLTLQDLILACLVSQNAVNTSL